ncbi:MULTISPECIES: hypothetical protein [Brevibacillus]|uniref:hypothetical protein n=1 Tax=Brevibacillus TaxID=55080 RepID=UPI001C222797|nr:MULTISPECIES: hypothetical protein [Brevibacillus]MBU8715593.1 hypothetical protein [Brevibacillus parabrevis]MDH6352226.1 hypothetical protein [Brevibacillus sp. 1238]
MKKSSKMIEVMLVATVLAVPGAAIGTAAPVYAYDGKSDLEVIPLPDDIRKLLVDLKEDYVPLLSDLHVDAIGKGSKSETILALSDRKSVITANIFLDLVVDADGNITSLKLNGADRDQQKWDKQATYKKLTDFIRENVPDHIVIATQPMLSTERKAGLDRLAVVPFYPVLNGVWVKKEMGRAYIDASGQIVHFWQEKKKLPLATEVADPKKAIALEKAASAWGNDLDVQLVYDTAAGKLVYEPVKLPVVDALTGEIVPEVTVTATETVKLKGTAGNSSWGDRTKMEEWLAKNFALKMSSLTFEAPSVKQKKRDTDLYEWNARMYQSASVLVERKSKSLLAFSLDGSAQSEREKPLSEDEAKALALRFAETNLLSREQSFVVKQTRPVDYLPGWADQNVVRPLYQYDFYPEANGIRAKTPLFTIEVDAKKGNVVKAKVNETAAMPAALDKQGVIGQERAKEMLLKHAALRLAYFYPQIGGQTAATPQLAYVPTADTEALQVEAKTGEVAGNWRELTE